MKLNETRPNIETSGNMEEKFFSIADVGMIFDILRNKMYSDPIRAICREISCNARDAHREVGKTDLPIQISLPHTFDPFLKIKDWGPGIGPDRIEEVYIRYTSSTKRNDNLQTGGYGIGSKTPFSYSDAFTIDTVFNGIQYSYSCFIDETKVGKLVCLKQEITDAPNSTEICIPVKPQDFRKFHDDTEYVTRHWSVRPTILGASINYQNIAPNLQGNNYAICKTFGYGVTREVKLIVDGIEYPLDIYQLKKSPGVKIFDAINGTFYLYFGVGELSLSATREAVHLDKSTQDKIENRLKDIIKDLKNDVLKQIEDQPSLWAANVWANTQLNKSFSDIAFLGDLTWNGTGLTLGRLSLKDASVYIFKKGQARGGRGRSSDPNKIVRSTGYSIDFVENSALYLCDLELQDIQVKNVKAAFNSDTSLKYLYVVKAHDSTNIEDVEKAYNLNALDAKNISSITKLTKSYTISGVRLLVFKYVSPGHSFKQTSYAAMEEDSNKKIICSLSRESRYSGYGPRYIVLKNKKTIESDIIESILVNHPGYSIYGVDNDIPADKLERHFSDFKSIDDFINDNVLNNKKTDFLLLKYASKNRWQLNNDIDKDSYYTKNLIDKNSIYFKYISLSKIFEKIDDHDLGLLKVYESVKGQISDKDIEIYITQHPDLNIHLIKEKINKTYPLLSSIDRYNRASDKNIVHYINLIDKENKSLKKV